MYVYGITTASNEHQVSMSGVKGARVDRVTHGDLAALTSNLDETSLDAGDLRAHWRVLEEAFESATVIPVRFGTVMDGENAVRVELLEPNSDRLTGLLEQLADLVQLNLSGRYDEQALLRAIIQSCPPVAQLRKRVRASPPQASGSPDQIRLGQLVDQEIRRQRAVDTDDAIRALAPLARELRQEEVSHPDAFKLAFLIERGAEPGFSKAVYELKERLGERIAIRYVGPLPPFSFVESDPSG